MHYNRYRYYDPNSGRFLSKDPIGLEGGFNVYQYAPNPNEYIDPLGLYNKYRKKDGTFAKKPGPKPQSKDDQTHGNSLNCPKNAVGYTLRDLDTNEIVKYGETTAAPATLRYSKLEYKQMNARMQIEAYGTKCEMHKWQHDKILAYKLANGGKRPKFNYNDY